MNKRTYRNEVECDSELEISSECGIWVQDIDGLILHLQSLKNAGATHIYSYFGCDEWSNEKFDSTAIEGVYFRTETDEEYNKRVEEENRNLNIYKEKQRQTEIQLLKELKQKYPNL